MNFIDNWQQPITLTADDDSAELSIPDGEYLLTICDSPTNPTRWETLFVEVQQGAAQLGRDSPQEWGQGSVIYCSLPAVLLEYLFQGVEEVWSLSDEVYQLGGDQDALRDALAALEGRIPEQFQPVVEITESRALQPSDAGKMLVYSGENPISLALPQDGPDAWPPGAELSIVQTGPGAVNFIPDPSWISIISRHRRITAGSGSVALIKRLWQDNWLLSGDLEPLPVPENDGGYIAVAASSAGIPGAAAEQLMIYTAMDCQPVAAIAAGGRGQSIAASPDGAYLALGCSLPAKVFIVSTSDWSIVEELDLAETNGSALAVEFSPDGRLLAVARRLVSPKLRIYSTGDWTLIPAQPQLPSGSATPGGLAFSPDGARLVVSTDISPYLEIYDTESWARSRPPSPLPGEAVNLAFSPDGALLAAVVRADPDVVLLNTDNWQPLAPPPGTTGEGNNPSALAFSPDGARLAASAWSQRTAIMSGPGFQDVARLEAADAVNGLAWSLDGAWIVMAQTSWDRPGVGLLHVETMEEIAQPGAPFSGNAVTVFRRPAN